MQSEVYCIKCLIDCITRKIKKNRHDALVRDSANRLCTAINIIRLVENIKRFMERMHNYIKTGYEYMSAYMHGTVYNNSKYFCS